LFEHDSASPRFGVNVLPHMKHFMGSRLATLGVTLVAPQPIAVVTAGAVGDTQPLSP
jgi:hypothetical protein